MVTTGMRHTERSTLVVGVTGIMGAGKSTVARVFEELGAGRIDADDLGKELLKSKRIKTAIVDFFGSKVIDSKGEIDTQKLGSLAFKDDRCATKLDEITREALISKIRARIGELSGSSDIVVVDAALLPEWDARAWIDVLIVVDSPEDASIARSAGTSRFTAKNVRRRMRCQFSRKDKSGSADIIIPNYGSVEELREKARKIFLSLVRIARKG
jgi:dephospho-CoA kinase